MVAILFYFLGAVCAVGGLQAQENLGSSTLRRSPTKRFFLLPKYLMKQMKPLNTNFPEATGSSETVSTMPHMLLNQEMNSLRSTNVPILPDQRVEMRPEGQDRLSRESRQLYEKELRELIDVSESTERSPESVAGGEQARFIAAPTTNDNSISRPCYFSPVQCLLNIPEERINNFVEFVVPVAGAESEDLSDDSEIAEDIDTMTDDNNRKAIRSAIGVTDPDMVSAASGLLEAQRSAGKEIAKSAAETPQRNRTPALRQRLASGGSLGSNGFGMHPSANPSVRNQPTSARDLAHMFLAQRHASRLRPFSMNGNGVSRTNSRNNWRLSL
ncbi:hypothetical protein DdX_14785 [Ditylenchus destructor]|uniref:Uncharacterized protein n=1 Tax=Ditylenchus destructor TaxID=166010 RepID=A0AAD4R1M4_9BILA|nr:hypothetical protein DdX_14785 [Ditylenchus destructor]